MIDFDNFRSLYEKFLCTWSVHTETMKTKNYTARTEENPPFSPDIIPCNHFV